MDLIFSGDAVLPPFYASATDEELERSVVDPRVVHDVDPPQSLPDDLDGISWTISDDAFPRGGPRGGPGIAWSIPRESISYSVPMTHLPIPNDTVVQRVAPVQSPPFYRIPGCANLRDIGGYALDPASPAYLAGKRSVTRGRLFRSAAPKTPTEREIALLADPTAFDHPDLAALPTSLRITTLFDLRSPSEIEALPTGYPPVGTTRVHVPATSTAADPAALALTYAAYLAEDTAVGFTRAYMEVLTHATAAFRALFSHLATPASASASTPTPTAALVHCSGGKDRAGLVSAFVLKVAGASDAVVAREYALSEVGMGTEFKAAAIARLLDSARQGKMGDVWAARAGGAALMGEDVDMPRVVDALGRMISAREESMLAFLENVAAVHGDVETYLMTCGVGREEIERVRETMTSEEEPIF